MLSSQEYQPSLKLTIQLFIYNVQHHTKTNQIYGDVRHDHKHNRNRSIKNPVQGSANFLCKKPESNYVIFCGPYIVSIIHSESSLSIVDRFCDFK